MGYGYYGIMYHISAIHILEAYGLGLISIKLARFTSLSQSLYLCLRLVAPPYIQGILTSPHVASIPEF
jgi:hypothetical protein